MLGFLLVNKPSGRSSHDVVHVARKALDFRKIGHAGTLDPLATGLLVLAVGPATRLMRFLQLEPKVYRAVFRFGSETDTYDTEGKVVSTCEPPVDLESRIRSALPTLCGDQEQLPPMYSAVKHEGERLYRLARKGEEIERKKRPVRISQLELINSDGIDFSFEISCSGGTYIRSIAFDLGRLVGCGAHMLSLERTRLGSFPLEDAVDMRDIEPSHIFAPIEALDHMHHVAISRKEAQDIRNGLFVYREDLPDQDHHCLVDDEGQLVAMAHRVGNELRPLRVIPKEAS